MNFKNQIAAIALVAGGLSPAFAAAGVVVGDVFPVPKLHVVDIIQSVANASHSFDAGDRCWVRVGANVTVVQQERGKALLRYDVEGAQGGNKCPDATLFALDEDIVQKFPQYARENEARDARLKNRVIAVLAALEEGALPNKGVAGLVTGDSLRVGGVAQVNLARPAQNEDTEFDFGENCAVDEGGNVTLLDFDNSQTKALVANDTKKVQRANSCPNGSLFVVDVKKLATLEKGWGASVEDTRGAVQGSERSGVIAELTAGSKAIASGVGQKAVQAKDFYFQKSDEYGTKAGEAGAEIAAQSKKVASQIGHKAVQAKDFYFEKSGKYGAKLGEAYFRASQATPKLVSQTKEQIKDGYGHVRDWLLRVTHWNH